MDIEGEHIGRRVRGLRCLRWRLADLRAAVDPFRLLRKRPSKTTAGVVLPRLRYPPCLMLPRCPVVISEADAIARYPELELLRMIRAVGWKFRPRVDESGDLVGLDGWRDWPGGCRDAIGIKASTDTCGIRLLCGELVWDVAGTLNDVVAELLVLPAPTDRTAPRLVVGSTPLWTP